MPLNEAELSRPKRVLVAVILLYAALNIGVARMVLDLYLAYPVTGPPWLTTMVNQTGIAWLLPIVVILSALVTTTLFLVIIYLIGQGKNWARVSFLVLWITGLLLFLRGHTAAEIPEGASDFRDVRPLAIRIASSCPGLALSE